MTSIFIIYEIIDASVPGVYSSLELAIKNANQYITNEWCIIEHKLDENPINYVNNVYEKDMDMEDDVNVTNVKPTNVKPNQPIFIIYDIDNRLVHGSYSSLELAIKHASECDFITNDEWCIIERKLDGIPTSSFNNVYEKNMEDDVIVKPKQKKQQQVFIIYDIDNQLIAGSYSSLELAIKNANQYITNEWCIIEHKIDENPIDYMNNVYEKDSGVWKTPFSMMNWR
jgi:hypothetical protein